MTLILAFCMVALKATCNTLKVFILFNYFYLFTFYFEILIEVVNSLLLFKSGYSCLFYMLSIALSLIDILFLVLELALT